MRISAFKIIGLVSLGVYLIWTHYAILNDDYREAIDKVLFWVFFLTIPFLLLYEGYSNRKEVDIEADFSISDVVDGAVFYMIHEPHVIIGALFLIVSFIRLFKILFTSKYHMDFECAAWYWLFVDIVWLFVIVIYWWEFPPLN